LNETVINLIKIMIYNSKEKRKFLMTKEILQRKKNEST